MEKCNLWLIILLFVCSELTHFELCVDYALSAVRDRVSKVVHKTLFSAKAPSVGKFRK